LFGHTKTIKGHNSKNYGILYSTRIYWKSYWSQRFVNIFLISNDKLIFALGKTVQTLIETYGLTNINLEDDGCIQIESFSIEKNDIVKAAILSIVVSLLIV
jgi:hypothetical protein